MDETVSVTFNPPLSVRKTGKSFWLERPGEDELQLPISETALTMCGNKVKSCTIPRWIAEDRGLIETLKEDDTDVMNKHDWFTLGLTMAFVIRGEGAREAVWEASKIMNNLDL